MSSKHLILFTAAALITFCLATVNGFGSIVGGRTAVANVKSNKEAQELGRFSVEEYNKKQTGGNGGGQLRFSEVVAAEKQVVSGFKYYLKIRALKLRNGEERFFDSQVVVKPWVRRSKPALVRFAPSTSDR